MRPTYLRAALLALGIGLAACVAMPANAGDTPQSQIASWTQSARATDAGFTPSADRGRLFFQNKSRHQADMESCAVCHTATPAAPGKHVITGKTIAPLSPMSNPERFADAGKTEKWFKRNCNDVLGRLCSAAEKADFVAFLLTQR